MEFKGKVVFIISYENWGTMLMSKHHYAIELGKAGNKVYFINHPDKRKQLKRGEIRIDRTDALNVFAISHRLFHPYFFKFKFGLAYHLLTRLHLGRIIKKVGSYPDIVWSFDSGNSLPLKCFPGSKLRILMPVDGPFGHKSEIQSAESADVIISVTSEILNVYRNVSVPKLLINHGVADIFLSRLPRQKSNGKVRIGYSGSLLRNDLDINCFLTIIQNHPDKLFEFWGEIDYRKSNIHLPQDVSNETLLFLQTLKKLPNVILHGAVRSETLAAGIMNMDALLICYNIKNDQNHHKVLEYLGTGKVIVSNYMSSYENDAHLLCMLSESDSNDKIPNLFASVISNLDFHNCDDKQEARKRYARQFSYANNIRRINEFINNTLKIK